MFAPIGAEIGQICQGRTFLASCEEVRCVLPRPLLVAEDSCFLAETRSDQLCQARPGKRRLLHGAFHIQVPRERIELRVEYLLPGKCFAGVSRHPAHDCHKRALGHLLELIDRLARDNAFEQINVFLDVGVDPSAPDAICDLPVNRKPLLWNWPLVPVNDSDTLLSVPSIWRHMLMTWTSLGNS